MCVLGMQCVSVLCVVRAVALAKRASVWFLLRAQTKPPPDSKRNQMQRQHTFRTDYLMNWCAFAHCFVLHSVVLSTEFAPNYMWYVQHWSLWAARVLSNSSISFDFQTIDLFVELKELCVYTSDILLFHFPSSNYNKNSWTKRIWTRWRRKR